MDDFTVFARGGRVIGYCVVCLTRIGTVLTFGFVLSSWFLYFVALLVLYIFHGWGIASFVFFFLGGRAPHLLSGRGAVPRPTTILFLEV